MRNVRHNAYCGLAETNKEKTSFSTAYRVLTNYTLLSLIDTAFVLQSLCYSHLRISNEEIQIVSQAINCTILVSMH